MPNLACYDQYLLGIADFRKSIVQKAPHVSSIKRDGGRFVVRLEKPDGRSVVTIKERSFVEGDDAEPWYTYGQNDAKLLVN